MDARLQEKCDNFVNNKETIRNTYKWEDGTISFAGAAIFSGTGKVVSKDELKKNQKILEKNSNVFSYFRDHLRVPILCKMSNQEDPEKYINDIMDIYNRIKAKYKFPSEYKVIAAITLKDMFAMNEIDRGIDKTVELFEKMEKEHMILTDNSSFPFAAMLSTVSAGTDFIIEDMEACYKILHNKFFGKTATLNLCKVLSMDRNHTPEYKCQRVLDAYEALKKSKLSFDTTKVSPALGILCFTDEPIDSLVKRIKEVYDYIKSQKGCGSIYLSKAERLMYSIMIVMEEETSCDSKMESTVLATTLSIVLAIELYMILLFVATTSATRSYYSS